MNSFRERRRAPDGTGRWLGWTSPLDPVWLWHALFDGTPVCRCAHSAGYRAEVPGELVS